MKKAFNVGGSARETCAVVCALKITLEAFENTMEMENEQIFYSTLHAMAYLGRCLDGHLADIAKEGTAQETRMIESSKVSAIEKAQSLVDACGRQNDTR